MSLYYQNKKNNPYLMEHSLYKRMAAMILDYPRMRAEIEDALYGRNLIDAPSKKSGSGNPTENKAIRVVQNSAECHAIEQAAIQINSEYYAKNPKFNALEAFENYNLFSCWLSGAHYNTYRKFKNKFCWRVAKKLGFL